MEDTKKRNQTIAFKALIVSCVFILFVVPLAGCKKSEQNQTSEQKSTHSETAEETSDSSSQETTLSEKTETTSQEQIFSETITETSEQTVTSDSSVESVPEPEQEPTTTLAFYVTDMSMTCYAIQDVNVRVGPSTNYERTGSLSAGQEVTVTGQADTGWYRISYNGGEAYVSNSYLTSDPPVPSEPSTTEILSQENSSPSTPDEPPVQPQPSDSREGKREQARAVAQQIADSIRSDPGMQTDLDRVGAAAYIVSTYCSNAVYTMEGENYSEAYGVFIAGEFSCAGATRALGMVLSCMGYEWEHVNENQWTHQWCRVTMDGQAGWADGQIGYAGYGRHFVEN